MMPTEKLRTLGESEGHVVAEACCSTTKAIASKWEENSAFIAEITNQRRGSN